MRECGEVSSRGGRLACSGRSRKERARAAEGEDVATIRPLNRSGPISGFVKNGGILAAVFLNVHGVAHNLLK